MSGKIKEVKRYITILEKMYNTRLENDINRITSAQITFYENNGFCHVIIRRGYSYLPGMFTAFCVDIPEFLEINGLVEEC